MAHFEQLKGHVSRHMMENMTAKFARISQSYSVHFETAAQAREFHDYMTENPMCWRDARDQSSHDIRVRSDLPGDVRSRQRQLGRVWSSVKELMVKKNFWSQSVRMGANGFRNEFYFIKDGDIWILFRGVVDPLNRMMCTATDDINHFGFDQADVDRMLRLLNE
eukprot:8214406-Pyramimonas_sp.AAC.1